MIDKNDSYADSESDAPRTAEEVARAIGAKPAAAAGAGSGDEALQREGPLRLDKSGALAGRPKLAPVRALRKEGGQPAPSPAPSRAPAAGGGGARRASLPPRLSTLRPAGFEAPASARAPKPSASDVEEIAIPAGTFLYGDGRRPRELGAFRIDAYPVTNAAYESFVHATGHRPPLYWPGGVLPAELRDHPVVGVDYYDALAYARWRGKDLPFEDEWERAARGTDGRVYPWGNDQDLSGANTARIGIKMTVPVDLHGGNVSPDGCRDMVGNVWEMTHTPASGGGIVVRGGSWYDFALYAKTFFRFASKAEARNGTIGFRCCRRDEERPDAPREVPAGDVDAEIAVRRGTPEAVDRSEWSVERRDLVPDLPRLRLHVAEVRAEELIAPKRGVAVALHEETPTPAGAPEPPPARKAAPEAAPPVVEKPKPKPKPAPAPEPVPEPEPEAVVETPPEETRIHVGTSDPVRPGMPTRVGGASADAVAAGEAGARGALPAAAASLAAAARRLPAPMWILLAAGFLLFGVLLIVLVNQGGAPAGPGHTSLLGDSGLLGESGVSEPTLLESDSEDPQGGDPAGPATAPVLADGELPEPLPYDAFPGANEMPRVIDGAAKAEAAGLLDGTWLLLFVDTRSADAGQTLQAAHDLHRRVASRGVRVAVVLDRARYARPDGTLGDREAVAARLKADSHNWLWDAIPVVLDGAGEDGRGRLHATYCRPEEPIAAVLLHHGRREGRTVPPSGGFRLATLARTGQRALDLAAEGR